MVNNFIMCLPNDLWDAELDSYIDSFKGWYDKLGCKAVLHRELTLYDDSLQLCGTLDGIFEINGEHVLLDYKTSVSVNPTWGLQLSAYQHLYRIANPDKHINRLQVIQLHKTGEPATVIEYDSKLDKFLDCLNLYKYFNPRSTRKRKEPRKAPIGDL
jgi:hypothetical protein